MEHYNFINKDKFNQITSSSGGSKYIYYEQIKPYTITKKNLKYTKSITANSDLLWYNMFSSLNNPYRNYIDSLYPNLLQWDNFSSMGIVAVNHGDKIVFNSTQFNYQNSSATGTVSDYLTTTANEKYPLYYEKVGYLRNTIDNSHNGYVLYDYGIYVLFNDCASALDLWTSNDSFTYSTLTEQFEIKIYCDMDGSKTKSTNNITYWTKIDETDSSITSALTAYWIQNNLPSLSISSDAYNWMILEQNDKPLFVTKLGLYNDKKECLAVATIKEPFKLINDFDMSFVISLKF